MPNNMGGSLRVYAETEYMKMLFDDVSLWHNMLAQFFAWIVLAGFLFLPGSFGTLSKLQINNEAYKDVLSTLQNIPLLVVGFSCSALGGIGMCYLWWHHRKNYAWLVDSIFIPASFGGLSGLISTFVDIYANKNGAYNAASIASVGVTGGCAVISGFLAVICSFWLLRRLKKEHDEAQGPKGSGP